MQNAIPCTPQLSNSLGKPLVVLQFGLVPTVPPIAARIWLVQFVPPGPQIFPIPLTVWLSILDPVIQAAQYCPPPASGIHPAIASFSTSPTPTITRNRATIATTSCLDIDTSLLVNEDKFPTNSETHLLAI